MSFIAGFVFGLLVAAAGIVFGVGYLVRHGNRNTTSDVLQSIASFIQPKESLKAREWSPQEPQEQRNPQQTHDRSGER
jgi:hypothetical protein